MRIFLPGLILEFIGVILLGSGILAGSGPVVIGGICLIACAIGVHIFRIAKDRRSPEKGAGAYGPGPSGHQGSPGDAAILYEDRLVTITGNAITFRNYSLLMKPRQVDFSDIDHIAVLEPSLTTGKYRIWGSGNFTMWFPMDAGRSSRDKIFHAYLKTRGMNIGFTVERSAEVIAIFRSKGLIRPES